MPVRPEGVRIVHKDGTVLPIELVYGGLTEQGLHEWLSLTPLNIAAGDALRVQMLPPETAIRMADAPQQV